MMLDGLRSISIWHHGIKGQKWGVRRSKEELRRIAQSSIEKPGESGTISKECYRSSKGFVIDKTKFSGYCLKPGATHYDHFEGVGYTMDTADRLFRDIESNYNVSRSFDVRRMDEHREKFSIPMELGITRKRLFRTVWMRDSSSNETRFITSYIDRSLKED